MTPFQKLKHLVLLKQQAWESDFLKGVEITADNVDALYEENDQDYELQDSRNEVRCSGTETGLKAPYSRHYESDAVAAQYVDGSWVGWTYWYGGGKHSEPEAIYWMEDAYEVNCTEEEKVVVVRTFTAPEAA
ncbi:MAG: hypothetical protein RJB68_356 [Pseudomonadota bacterium]|jgi:hypothetical protein